MGSNPLFAALITLLIEMIRQEMSEKRPVTTQDEQQARNCVCIPTTNQPSDGGPWVPYYDPNGNPDKWKWKNVTTITGWPA